MWFAIDFLHSIQYLFSSTIITLSAWLSNYISKEIKQLLKAIQHIQVWIKLCFLWETSNPQSLIKYMHIYIYICPINILQLLSLKIWHWTKRRGKLTITGLIRLPKSPWMGTRILWWVRYHVHVHPVRKMHGGLLIWRKHTTSTMLPSPTRKTLVSNIILCMFYLNPPLYLNWIEYSIYGVFELNDICKYMAVTIWLWLWLFS